MSEQHPHCDGEEALGECGRCLDERVLNDDGFCNDCAEILDTEDGKCHMCGADAMFDDAVVCEQCFLSGDADTFMPCPTCGDEFLADGNGYCSPECAEADGEVIF